MLFSILTKIFAREMTAYTHRVEIQTENSLREGRLDAQKDIDSFNIEGFMGKPVICMSGQVLVGFVHSTVKLMSDQELMQMRATDGEDYTIFSSARHFTPQLFKALCETDSKTVSTLLDKRCVYDAEVLMRQMRESDFLSKLSTYASTMPESSNREELTVWVEQQLLDKKLSVARRNKVSKL